MIDRAWREANLQGCRIIIHSDVKGEVLALRKPTHDIPNRIWMPLMHATHNKLYFILYYLF